MLLSIGTFLGTGPIAHAMHPGNEAGRFLTSILLRAGAPLGGMLLGCMADEKSDKEHRSVCGSPKLVVGGMAAGAIGGALIDDLLVARRPAPAAAPALLRLKPSLAMGKEGAVLGLSGAW